jgi:hypothetical protein
LQALFGVLNKFLGGVGALFRCPSRHFDSIMNSFGDRATCARRLMCGFGNVLRGSI